MIPDIVQNISFNATSILHMHTYIFYTISIPLDSYIPEYIPELPLYWLQSFQKKKLHNFADAE